METLKLEKMLSYSKAFDLSEDQGPDFQLTMSQMCDWSKVNTKSVESMLQVSSIYFKNNNNQKAVYFFLNWSHKFTENNIWVVI